MTDSLVQEPQVEFARGFDDKGVAWSLALEVERKDGKKIEFISFKTFEEQNYFYSMIDAFVETHTKIKGN